MRLLGVELRRLRARIAIVVLALIGLLGTVLLGVQTYIITAPMSAEAIEQAEYQWELAQQSWREHGEQQVADCEAAQEQESERVGEQLDFGCDQMAPQREWYFPEPTPFEYLYPDLLSEGVLVLALLAIIVGVSFVAAEFSSGTIGTWLTFVPRRGAVFGSKIGAVVLAATGYSVVWLGLFVGFIVLGYVINDVAADVTVEQIWPLARLAVAVGGLAAIGAGLGFLVRHSAAALGVVAGFLIVVDVIGLRQVVPAGGRWAPTTNLTAWVVGEGYYFVQECETGAEGTMCQLTQHTVSMTQGGLVLAGLVVVVLAVAYLTFRRRDV